MDKELILKNDVKKMTEAKRRNKGKTMNKSPHSLTKRSNAPLFDRVVSILEEAQSNVVRAVNNSMVIAYWLIGREIVQEVQGGEDRAKYGEKVIEQLSSQLKEKYGRGFSISNLRYFRTFYTVYSDRKPEIRQIGSGELVKSSKGRILNGVLSDMSLAVETASDIRDFSPNLGWSHYQSIMTVENPNERLFYDINKPIGVSDYELTRALPDQLKSN